MTPDANNDERFEKLIADLTAANKMDMALALQIATFISKDTRSIVAQYQLEVKEEVSELRQELRSTTVNNLRRIISLETTFDQLKKDLTDSRMQRADQEVRAAEMRLQLAKETKSGLSTDERIELKVAETLTQKEQSKNKEVMSAWSKRWESVVTGIMVTFGISLATGFLGMMWWLIRMYLDNQP